MSGNLNTNFTADETSLVKAQAKLIKQQEEMIEKYKKLGAEAKKGGKDAERATADAAKELDRFAKATTQINRTPLEKYADEMKKLDAALKAGKIDQETFNRAVAKTKTEFQQAGHAGEKSFGSTAIASLAQYAIGMASITTVTRLFANAMAYAKEKTDTAMQSVEGLIASRSQLQQVSEGKGGADVQRMNEQANQLAELGISREAAQSVIFSARSEQFVGHEEQVARLIAANEFKAESVRTMAGQIPQVFDKSITSMQGIAGGALGAKVSRLNVEEYAALLPKAAQAGTIAGGTPAETFALAAVTSMRGERAMEYAATMAGQLVYGEKGKQFKGLGVIGQVEKLQGMPEAQRRELLGTGKESNLIYEWVSRDMARLKEVRALEQKAMDDSESFVAGVEAKAFDPTTQQGRLMIGRRESIVETNKLQVQREAQLATGGYERQAAKTRGIALNERRGVEPITEYVSAKGMEYAAGVEGMPAGAVPWGGTAALAISISPAFAALDAVAKMLFGASEKLDDSAENLSRATGDTGRQRAAAAVQPE